jgi:hypothetical protein
MERGWQSGWIAARAALATALLVAVGTTPAYAAGTPATRARTPTARAETPADAAATAAYLAALYAQTQAVVANLPASTAAFEGLAARIGGECPGVLAGAPGTALPSFGADRESARERGEHARERDQWSELDAELSLALDSALSQPDQQAVSAFASAVGPLRWSNPAIAQAVQLELAQFEELLAVTPDVCADMRAWVASGYRTLSAGTREFRARREAADRRDVHEQPVIFLLAPYESAADKALLHRTDQLQSQGIGSLKTLARTRASLRQTLGLTRPRVGQAIETVSRPATRSIAIAHGRTAAGGRYSVLVEQPLRGHSGAAPRGCVSVTVTEHHGIFTPGRSGGCYSRSHVHGGGSVNCNEGQLSIHAQTDPRARTVSLRLSDGRRIVSRVALVPARLGGPVGLYYQVVRGPSPIPVSLTELDAHGAVLRVVKLPRIVECTRHPLKYLPRGVRTLVHETVPQGPSFAIVGEAYRFLGRLYFNLKVNVESASETEFSASSDTSVFFAFHGKPHPFSPQFETTCKPHPYEIVYGLLRAPRDTVLARSTSGALDPLRQLAIPAGMHAHGALVYGALATAPTALIVRAPSGATVATQKLEGIATEAFETCQGEAEPES